MEVFRRDERWRSSAADRRHSTKFGIAVVVPAGPTPRALAGRLIASLREQGGDVVTVFGGGLADVEHGCHDIDAIVGFPDNADAVRRVASARGVPCAVAREHSMEQLVSSLRRAERRQPVLTTRVICWPIPVVALRRVDIGVIGGSLTVTARGGLYGVADGRFTAELELGPARSWRVSTSLFDRQGGKILQNSVAVDDSMTIRVRGSSTITIDGCLRRAPDSATIELGPHRRWLIEAVAG